VGVVLLAGCGGDSSDDRLKADHRLSQAQTEFEVDSFRRVGEWSSSGDLLTAWVVVDTESRKPYVACVSVDLSQQIDNADDVRLAVVRVRDDDCQGRKPMP
jgi:hypothetical protein